MKSLTPVDAKSFKAVVHVPEGCPLGEQIVQVRAKSGISEYRSFWVGGLPIVDEKEPNGLPEQAQAVPLSTTRARRRRRARISTSSPWNCKKGQRLSVEVEGLRLGSHRFDPHIAIVDAKRFQLAAADDSPATLQDGILSVAGPGGRPLLRADPGGVVRGRRAIAVSAAHRHVSAALRGLPGRRQGRREGEGDVPRRCRRADRAGDRRARAVPAGGDARGCSPPTTAASAPPALPFRISAFGNMLEQEPNNDVEDGHLRPTRRSRSTASSAIRATSTASGSAPRRGSRSRSKCHARRPAVGPRSGRPTSCRPDGRTSPATTTPNGPRLRRPRSTCPRTASTCSGSRDHLGRGQPDFTYRVEFESPTAVALPLDSAVDRYSQTRQTVFVPRGNRFAVLVERGPARTSTATCVLDGGQLPAGITMQAPAMKAGTDAGAGRLRGGGRRADRRPARDQFEARHVTEQDPEGKAGVRGHFKNARRLRARRPRTTPSTTAADVEKLAVAVIDAVPFHVEIVQPKAPLVKHGTIDLKVVVTRDEGFTQPVTVELPFRPPGVGAAPSITIPAEAVGGDLPDQRRRQGRVWAPGRSTCIAAADVGGTAWVASPLAHARGGRAVHEGRRSPGPPASRASRPRSPARSTQVRPFEGEAVARLHGLPPEATAPRAQIHEGHEGSRLRGGHDRQEPGRQPQVGVRGAR